ncbi:MAG: hypothetical protein AB1714_13665 [Acidobacteriota bacterium]
MTEQSGFRVGDIASAAVPQRNQDGPSSKGQLDPMAFPTLSELVHLPSNEFRNKVDELATMGRRESSAAVQKALLLAAQMLPVIQKTFGGKP